MRNVAGNPEAGRRDKNKQGQVLGLKGRRTRGRLMECGRVLLASQSPIEMTAVAVAKAADISIASFYLYFDDVSDLLYELSCEASEDMSGVRKALLEDWDDQDPVEINARRFVDAFLAVWSLHRPVLRYRNLEADRGDERFSELRIASLTPIISALGDKIYAAGLPVRRYSKGDARTAALLFVTAMNGLATADPERSEKEFGLDRIVRVLTHLLTRSLEV